jgi:hypothetical protein
VGRYDDRPDRKGSYNCKDNNSQKLCYALGNFINSQIKYSELSMKQLTSHEILLGVWGLNVTSYLVSSIPYLQFASLTLAIIVSIVTLRRLAKQEKDDLLDE